MRWKTTPEQLTPDTPGLVRWKPVEGATSYEVWWVDIGNGKVVSTTTNLADEREFYTFHQTPSWTGIIRWRVRAVRKLYGQLPNGLPTVSYGPWTDTFVSTNPSMSTGPVTLAQTVSDVSTTNSAPADARPDSRIRVRRRHGDERPRADGSTASTSPPTASA